MQVGMRIGATTTSSVLALLVSSGVYNVLQSRRNCVYNMWQSRVEIKGYSIEYLDHIAVFKALYCCTSVKVIRFVD